jgi:YD repeat-containing protein
LKQVTGKLLCVLALLLLVGSVHGQDRPTPPASGSRTFYDAQGRISGTASTSGNVTTFRDGMGRLTGTAERMPDGRMEFRDSTGRLTGSSGH